MSERQPTRFGLFLLRRMASHEPPLSQSDVARLASVSQSTISRWIFDEGLPNYAKLETLAPALGVTADELRLQAGYGRPASEIGAKPDLDPLAAEVDQMLGSASRIPAADREHLRVIIDRVIDPYRKRRRRGSA